MIPEKNLLYIESAAKKDYSNHMNYWKNNADSLCMGLQCFLITWNYFVNKDLSTSNKDNPRWITD